MSTFTLDTSGAVPMGRGENIGLAGVNLRWDDPQMTPFVRGCAEGVLREVFEFATLPDGSPYGFRHLAPETLAAILKDCERLLEIGNRPGASGWDEGRAREQGAGFWVGRQGGVWAPTFPPRIPYLGDDGRVYLREAGQ
jgi:hypothetical protein